MDLNSDPLSNMTLRGCGYLHSHVLLNNWLTLADNFIYVFIITCRYLIEVERRYLSDLEQACGGVNHRRTSQTIIILNDSSA